MINLGRGLPKIQNCAKCYSLILFEQRDEFAPAGSCCVIMTRKGEICAKRGLFQPKNSKLKRGTPYIRDKHLFIIYNIILTEGHCHCHCQWHTHTPKGGGASRHLFHISEKSLNNVRTRPHPIASRIAQSADYWFHRFSFLSPFHPRLLTIFPLSIFFSVFTALPTSQTTCIQIKLENISISSKILHRGWL